MHRKLFIVAGLSLILLTGCNNNADVEERFQMFTEENNYSPEDIAHNEPPEKGGVTFHLKEDISVRQSTRGTLFNRGDMQLLTRFVGPAEKGLIDDYVAILEFSMKAPDETGFEFERMVEDMVEQDAYSREYYFTGDISVNLQSYPDKEERKVIDVHVNHQLAKDVFGEVPSPSIAKKGIEERLKPMPKYLEMTGNKDGVHKKVSRLISRGLDRMSGYIEHGDDPDISYYKHLDVTLESYIPYTKQALEAAEDKAIKKDLEETLDLLQDLDNQAEDIDRYAENESILRLVEIYRDLDHYVRRNFYSQPTNSTHFAKKVKEAQQNG